MEKKATSMILEARFDIDQVGNTLEYRFARRDKHGNPIHGKDAGAIYFTVGEQFFVTVKGGSKIPFRSFSVVDCCLISNPQIYRCGPGLPTEYAPPSPFEPAKEGATRGASVNLPGEQFEARMVEPHDKYFEISQVWTDHLTVGDVAARWELSVVITVRITPQEGDSYLRVFSFDPEAVVGTAVVPEAIEPRPEMAMLMPEPVVGTAVVPE